MPPLPEDAPFTFRCADDGALSRFHLEGAPAGGRVALFTIDPTTGRKRDLLSRATVGAGGWVELPEPLVVRAGEVFLAAPEPGRLDGSIGRMLATAGGVAGLLAAVGYGGGLAFGGGNHVALALCCGALGAFVVLVGYGPIALLIGALGAVAQWLPRKTTGPEGTRKEG
jgi:hypothetical protein